MAKADNAYDTSLHSEGDLRHCICVVHLKSWCLNSRKYLLPIPTPPSFFSSFISIFLEETLPFLIISRAIVWVASLLAELGTEPWSRHLHTWFSIAGLHWAADKRFLLTQLFTSEVKGMTHERSQRGRTSRINIMFIH